MTSPGGNNGGGSGGSGGNSGGSGGSGGSSGGGSGGSSGGGGGSTAGMPVQRNSAMCPSFVGARVVRITRLNACGAPMFGPENVVTTRGIVTATFEPEVEEGESLDTQNLNGELCVQGTTPDSLTGINVSMEFCQVDPAVFQIMNPNWKLVRNSRDDHSGDIVGWRIGSNVSDEFGFALEMWPKTMGQTNSACEQDEEADPSDPANVHGYFLLPFVMGKAPDEWEITGDEVATFTLNGMTKGGANWDIGPYVVTRDEAKTPSPLLRPIEDGSGKGGFKHPVTGQVMSDPDHFHAEVVSVTPPEPQCGAQDLIRPKIAFEQQGNRVQVTLLNADEVAPPDPRTGRRPPVWVAWGDGSHRTNLTDPAHEDRMNPDDIDPDDGEDADEEPDEELSQPNIDVSQDDSNPRRVTVDASEFPDDVDELDVDWGGEVRENPDDGQGDDTDEPVTFTQDEDNPRRVTATANRTPATIDWGADVQEDNA